MHFLVLFTQKIIYNLQLTIVFICAASKMKYVMIKILIPHSYSIQQVCESLWTFFFFFWNLKLWHKSYIRRQFVHL